jgi:hypothetical protein
MTFESVRLQFQQSNYFVAQLLNCCKITWEQGCIAVALRSALVIPGGSQGRVVGEQLGRTSSFGLDGRRQGELLLLCFQVSSRDACRG